MVNNMTSKKENKALELDYNSKAKELKKLKLEKINISGKFLKGKITYEDNSYHKLYKVMKHPLTNELLLPKIVGLKGFSCVEETYTGFRPLEACRLDKVLYQNHRLGENTCKLVGSFGCGKSSLVSQLAMFKIADFFKKDNKNYGRYHAYTFVDIFNEIRHFALYGFYTQDTNEFIPFRINYLIPNEIDFKINEITDKLLNRNNVKITHYSTIKEIADIIIKEPYTVHGIYTECFSTADTLKIFILLYEYFRKAELSRQNGFDPLLFFHHELSQLFPQALSQENHHLLQYASDRFVEFRKGNIMPIGCMQLKSEMYYRFNQKFVTTINMRQNPSHALFPPQKRTLSYGIGDFNIEKDGYYMEHSIKELQEIKEIKLNYKFKNEEKDNNEKISIESYLTDSELKIITKPKEFLSKKFIKDFRNANIRLLYLEYDISQNDLSKTYNLTQQSISKICNQSNKKDEKILRFEVE
jgi:hypothetical protein